jgi:hypothetical protein
VMCLLSTSKADTVSDTCFTCASSVNGKLTKRVENSLSD